MCTYILCFSLSGWIVPNSAEEDTRRDLKLNGDEICHRRGEENKKRTDNNIVIILMSLLILSGKNQMKNVNTQYGRSEILKSGSVNTKVCRFSWKKNAPLTASQVPKLHLENPINFPSFLTISSWQSTFISRHEAAVIRKANTEWTHPH